MSVVEQHLSSRARMPEMYEQGHGLNEWVGRYRKNRQQIASVTAQNQKLKREAARLESLLDVHRQELERVTAQAQVNKQRAEQAKKHHGDLVAEREALNQQIAAGKRQLVGKQRDRDIAKQDLLKRHQQWCIKVEERRKLEHQSEALQDKIVVAEEERERAEHEAGHMQARLNREAQLLAAKRGAMDGMTDAVSHAFDDTPRHAPTMSSRTPSVAVLATSSQPPSQPPSPGRESASPKASGRAAQQPAPQPDYPADHHPSPPGSARLVPGSRNSLLESY